MIKTKWTGKATSSLLLSGLVTVLSSALAQAAPGQPTAGQMTFQDPATPIAEQIQWFHNSLVNPIIVGITVFVMLLMAYVMWRFSEKRNPTPSRTSHNTALEVAWTVIPIAILLIIAIPSFRLLYAQYSYPKPDLTIKAVGNAWFWEHEYPDNGNVKVTSNMITDEELIKAKLGDAEFNKKFAGLGGTDRTKALHEAATPLWLNAPDKYAGSRLVRQLSVDNEIAVPVNKTVHLLVTSNDVIHSWTIPSFGSKVQAVPGRITATWFKPTKEGIYYGQCSVLCGKEHSSMPIAVRVVSDKAFNDWLAAAKAKDWKRARAILASATEGKEPKTVAELTGGQQ
ncbi:MAG: cytochrome c oxidase subunit II [Hyphomicrobiaceae bacterium]